MPLILIFTMMANLPNASTIEPLSPGKGPRTEDLIIRYYSNVKDAYLALKAGDIDIIGSEIHGYIEPIPANPIDDYVWIASFGPDNLDNNNLPGRYVGNDYSYNGFGVPNWTGDFSLDYPFTSVNEINVTCLGFTPDNYTFTLSEGVDYLVHADEDLIELLSPVDVPVINEHWKDGVNNTLNGMPSINYVASGIESVYVDMNNGTSRFGQNFGYAMPPPSEWWYDPDWTWELEGWWALGWFLGAWNWPAGSDWWINYTAASYLTIDYNAENPQLGMDILVDAMNDPNICLGHVGDRGKYEFDINNNYTCSPLFPGLRSPTNYLNFRRALAFLVDKAQVVDTFCGGFANRIDQPIAYQHKGWRNQSYWYEDGTYPYEYNPVLSGAAFDAAGFVQGTDANPDYDPGSPGSAAFLRIHPDTGVTMGLLEVCVRTDDARRLEAGRALCDQLRLAGIPVNQFEASSAVLYPKVVDNFEYHVYTGGWSLGRFPAVSAYGLYHSSQYMLGGSNYVTGDDSLGNPMYPVLDSYLYTARFPADYAEAQTAARKVFGEIVDQCITIELFSAASFWAWSAKLLGVVNMDGIGPINSYTFMNAYRYDIVNGRPKPTNQPIRLGLCTSPNEMNKIYSRSYYDYQCLDRMDLYSGINVAPYDQSVDQPGYILDWTVDTWVDPDDPIDPKSKISQTYREDAWFVEPITGNQLEHVNITHHYASIWYEYQLSDAWNHDSVEDIKTLRMPDPYTIEIYWNVPGYWNTYMGTTSIKSFNWWSQGTLSQTVTDNNLVPDGAGYISCTEPVFYVLSITGDGTPLVLGTDYDIYMDSDGPHNADVRIITGPYADVDITYLATDDARGYTPGCLPWQTSFEGAGMFYAIDHIPLTGGYLTLKRNPFYWMETPTLGEIDFVIKPSGEQKVDMHDLTIAASAYGSQGISVPSVHWFPGADLFPFGGFIDGFDTMVVQNVYGNGHPPVGHNVTLADITPLQTEVTSGTLVPISITVANPGDYTETFNANVCVNRTEVASVEVTLSSGEGTTIILTWDTSCFQGNYTVSAYVGPVDYEEGMWDNILIDNTVEVTPVQYTITVEEEGQEYYLEIESDTTLTYIVATANFLHFGATGPSGQTAYVNSTIPLGLNTTTIEVYVDNVELTYPPFPIITTNSTHYFVYFEITLSTHDLIIGLTPPEVVVTNVSSAKTAVGQGYTSYINMTVHNQGNYTKTFNATLFADQDSIIIGDEIAMRMLNVTLTSGNSTTITFTFNTTSLAKGNYTLCGVVDDSMVDGWVFVTIPGDVDMDRDVDIFDIVAMVGSYGSEIGDPEYKANYDLDSDGDIDIFDIVIAAGNYLESW